MVRSRGLVVGAVVVAAGVVALLVVLLTRHGDHAAAGDPGKGGPTASAGSPDQARQVAAALSRLATDPSSLVAAGARDGVEGRAAQGVPKGSKVTPEPASWAPDGAGGGVMTVTVAPPGGPAVGYAAVMVNEGGSWKVLATMRLPAAAATPTAVAS